MLGALPFSGDTGFSACAVFPRMMLRLFQHPWSMGLKNSSPKMHFVFLSSSIYPWDVTRPKLSESVA
jgi:hypothetical protein